MQQRHRESRFRRIMTALDRFAATSVLGEQALLTPRHMAKVLRCSTPVVAKLRRERKLLPPVLIGSKYRWRLDNMRLRARKKYDIYTEIGANQPSSTAALSDNAELSIKQFAGFLGCSERYLMKLEKRGELPPVSQVARPLRWRVRDVRGWVIKGCRN